MKCPTCNNNNIIKLKDFYTCEKCITPKYDLEDVVELITIGVSIKNPNNGFFIEINSNGLNGIYKIKGVNNYTGEEINKNLFKYINIYKLSDNNNEDCGSVVTYEGISKHYYSYNNNGKCIMLSKEDFKVKYIK